MPQLETALRGGVTALILVLAALAARQARRSVIDRYSTIFALCAVAYLVESAPALARQRDWWICAVRLVSVSTPAVFWLWIKARFDDPYVPSWRNWLPVAGLAALGAWAMAADRATPWRVVQLAGLGFVGLGIWLTLYGRGGDLVEARRRLRLGLAVCAALYIAVIEFVSWQALADGLATTIALELALAGYAAFAIALRVASIPVAAPAEAAPATARPNPPADPEEARLLEALRRAMEVDKAYREERCSIAMLAARLGIPEYRLRRLINQRLGYRNFTRYINGYRLAETAAALADPSQARVPILTIALDAGFQSLGPFNRAFKAHAGVTPSEFRRLRLGEPDEALLPSASPIPKSASG